MNNNVILEINKSLIIISICKLQWKLKKRSLQFLPCPIHMTLITKLKYNSFLKLTYLFMLVILLNSHSKDNCKISELF